MQPAQDTPSHIPAPPQLIGDLVEFVLDQQIYALRTTQFGTAIPPK